MFTNFYSKSEGCSVNQTSHILLPSSWESDIPDKTNINTRQKQCIPNQSNFSLINCKIRIRKRTLIFIYYRIKPNLTAEYSLRYANFHCMFVHDRNPKELISLMNTIDVSMHLVHNYMINILVMMFEMINQLQYLIRCFILDALR